jgi:hypothetical protein
MAKVRAKLHAMHCASCGKDTAHRVIGHGHSECVDCRSLYVHADAKKRMELRAAAKAMAPGQYVMEKVRRIHRGMYWNRVNVNAKREAFTRAAAESRAKFEGK